MAAGARANGQPAPSAALSQLLALVWKTELSAAAQVAAYQVRCPYVVRTTVPGKRGVAALWNLMAAAPCVVS